MERGAAQQIVPMARQGGCQSFPPLKVRVAAVVGSTVKAAFREVLGAADGMPEAQVTPQAHRPLKVIVGPHHRAAVVAQEQRAALGTLLAMVAAAMAEAARHLRLLDRQSLMPVVVAVVGLSTATNVPPELEDREAVAEARGATHTHRQWRALQIQAAAVVAQGTVAAPLLLLGMAVPV